MEHLPLPHDADVSALPRIHLLTSSTISRGAFGTYDGESFLSYPLRLVPERLELLPGTMKNSSKWASTIRSIPCEELEVIIQSWLLFGLIFEILGETLCQDAIRVIVSSNEPSETYLTTAGLNDAVRQWIHHCKADPSTVHDQKNIEQRCSRYMDCLWHTFNCLRAITETGNQNLGTILSREFNSSLLCSIASVAEVLSTAVYQAFEGKNTKRHLFPFAQFFRTPGSNKVLLLHGWCPSEIAVMNESTELITLQHYLSQMQQPFAAANLHEACDETRCLTLQNKPEGYIIAHRTNRCDCSMVPADLQSINTGFTHEPGSYPLLQISDDEVPRIDIVIRSMNTPYVAISHLWADGLGNPDANAMPTCQIKYLRLIIADLKYHLVKVKSIKAEDELFIFIDTLIFPARSDDILKAKALKEMGNIYKNATSVLILDKALVNYRFDDMGEHESLTRLCYSRWATRLWTLQEGAFAKTLWVQFQDCAVDVERLRQSVLPNAEGFGKNSVLSKGLLSRYYSWKPAGDLDQIENVHPLASMSMSIWQRNCSVATDEALCISTYLQFDLKLTALSKPEDRMQSFWTSVEASRRGIPPQIIAYQGPRIDAAGFRWAPASFLQASGCVQRFENNYSDPSTTRAHITPLGLHVKFPGFRIASPPWRCSFTTAFAKKWDIVNLLGTGGADYIMFMQLKLTDTTETLTGNDTLGDLMLRADSQAVVLATGGTFSLVEYEEKRVLRGVYGLCHSEDSNDFNSVKSERIVGVQRMDPSRQRFFSAAFEVAVIVKDKLRDAIHPADSSETFDFVLPSTAENAFRAYIQELADQKMAENPDLLVIATNLFPANPSGGFFREVVRVVVGNYGVIVEEYSSIKDWVID